ncbi:leucine-rich repeat protein [Lachnospiraceae bacterium JLR.KK009]
MVNKKLGKRLMAVFLSAALLVPAPMASAAGLPGTGQLEELSGENQPVGERLKDISQEEGADGNQEDIREDALKDAPAGSREGVPDNSREGAEGGTPEGDESGGTPEGGESGGTTEGGDGGTGTEAQEFVVDEKGVLTAYNGAGGELTIPAEVEGVAVTGIAEKVFDEKKQELTKVTISAGITEIPKDLFKGCAKLEEVVFPNSLEKLGRESFKGCVKLANVEFPENLEEIGYYAFMGCTSLKSIHFPLKTNFIYEGAFMECTALEQITFEDGESSQQCSLNDTAFEGCTSLTSVVFPVVRYVSVAGGTFQGCTSLTEFKLAGASSYYDIFDGCLYKDTTISFGEEPRKDLVACPAGKTEVRFLEGVEAIWGSVFAKSKLTSVEIPDTVTEIGSGAFDCCSALTKVILPPNLSEVSSYLFRSTGITEIKIPETVNNIGSYAFDGCTGLKTVTIPGKALAVWNEAFRGCTGLESVYLQEGVDRIDSRAFEGCTSLKTLVIPESVTFIAYDAMPEDTENLTIYGKKGSKAEDIARNKNIDFSTEQPPQPPSTEEPGEEINDISNAAFIVTLEPAVYDYDGKEKSPAVTVKKGEQELRLGTDFTVDYENNINPGTAKAIVTGRKLYTGTVTKEFTIKGIDISNSGFAVTLSETQYTYDGKAKEPTVTVTKGTEKLRGTDFTVKYENNIKPGTAKAIVTGAGIYTGSVTKEFTIKRSDISSAGFTVTLSQTAYTYDGKAKKPTVTVTKGTEKLRGTDFTVKYENNIKPGTAKAIVTGAGVYTGTVTKEFTIKEAKKKNIGLTCKKVFTKKYGDKAFSLQAKAAKGAKITYKTSDKKVAVVDKKGKVTIKGTGIATITVKATASGYNDKTLKVTVKVSPSKASAPSLKTLRGRKLKVSWKKDRRATGYQVQYCTSKAFKKGVKTITISKNKTLTKTIPKLTKGKRYYVRVRAYKSVKVNKKTQKLYGAWSSVKRSGKILR